MKRIPALSVLIAAGTLSLSAAYQRQPPGPKVLEVEQLKDNLYILKGSIDPATNTPRGGGNTAVFVTSSGVVVVDTKDPGWGQPILDAIRRLTDKPVTMIINTHTHGDHTSGNVEFPASVDIVAQENAKASMTTMNIFKGDGSTFLPKKTFKNQMSLLSGKDRIDLYYFGPGHTSGDTWVVFPFLRVVHAADMFARKDAPLYDRRNGGSGVLFPQTLSKALAGIKGVDTVITGHSSTMTWKDLEEHQRFNRDLLAEVRQAIKAGRSVDEASASVSHNLADKYKGYQSQMQSSEGRRHMRGAVEAIYGELKP